MEIMGRFRTGHDTADTAGTDESIVILETDDHETVVFRGTSQDEVDAKVEDFLTWAS